MSRVKMETTKPFTAIKMLFLLLAALVFVPNAPAAEELPLGGYKEIRAFELKKLVDTKPQTLIINVLSNIEFDIQHISGSINIPIIDMLHTDKLPQNQETPLVFHCLSER